MHVAGTECMIGKIDGRGLQISLVADSLPPAGVKSATSTQVDSFSDCVNTTELWSPSPYWPVPFN